MIGIDTNVLLRFLLADDAQQFEAVKNFVSARSLEDPAFVSLFVVAETSWVLKRRYGFTNTSIATALRRLLPAEQFLFEDEDFLDSLFEDEQASVNNLSDCLVAHMARRAGCLTTFTFDKRAASRVPGMELLV
ncbi:type II toxin-antitoxin system VapC family toxin [Ciceribacter sp. L1K22]|uniref:PIN domain-containing protein n=1 Tax=Ciceribacter sp. L1K22 TaxID=2820275 RepID=UPI001ABED7B9|nr:type II toxin-antitoxin system VapC family toxin [Ciceribacter sp. L1K22]MBO3761921.1 type II toxin-antitoxin system VapC family toxin [Ciceribacter sp. L1K22]